ncbi:hypothetical protein ACROYT_G041866 [Oculina patagonica]
MEFGRVDFCGGKKLENPEKNPQSKAENEQQTLPTYDAKSWNRTGANWWEARTLTTAPSLLPSIFYNNSALTKSHDCTYKDVFNPYSTFNKCKICKQTVHQAHSHYCQGCAYKKGICAMCGKQVLDTSNYRQTSV